MDSIVQHLQNFIHEQIYTNFRKRGIVIGISGGIDSAVAAKLCCNAIGKENVLAVIYLKKNPTHKAKNLQKNTVKN